MTTPSKAEKIVIPITDAERHQALSFAQEQPSREKAQQVYLNTLAVQAVKQCLDILEIPTNLTTSDSWNPFSRLAADVADLHLPGLGVLECRPVRGDVQDCYIPSEVMENRIGYVIVQIDQCYQEARLLGFIPCASAMQPLFQQHSPDSEFQLSLVNLYSIQELFIHLDEIAAHQPSSGSITHLSHWLTSLTDSADRAWQTVEALLGRYPQPAFAFRVWRGSQLDTPEKIQRMVEQLYATHQFGRAPSDAMPALHNTDIKAALAHLIQTATAEELRWKAAEILWTLEPGHPATGVQRMMDLGLLLAEHPVALMVAVMRVENHFSILARVYPLGIGSGSPQESVLHENSSCLPAGLQLTLLSQDGTPEVATQARERDNYIQLKFTGEAGEAFGIRVSLNYDGITEYFVI